MSREELLQYIWKTCSLGKYSPKTTCGQVLFILSPGEQNFHAGPDFLDARIRIGPILWVGNVELHCRGSEWKKHGHHIDHAYNNVILHVVLDDDQPAYTCSGRKVPVLLLHIPTSLLSFYLALKQNESWLPCQHAILTISRERIAGWLTHLQGERLENKIRQISTLYMRTGSDWDASLYIALAWGFGLPINSLPFEMTTFRIPYRVIIQSRDSLTDLEGIIFGQAGFLQPGKQPGPYETTLFRKFQHHRNSLPNSQVDRHLWKFLRLRPASFPTLRLSQFAALIHHRFPLLEPILQASSASDIEQLLRVKSSEYWNTHFRFGKCSPESEKYLGHHAARTLTINTIVPYLFFFGKKRGCAEAISLGTGILQEMEAESNHIIRQWATLGITPRDAFESQALIQLYNSYCKQKRCLECKIGTGIFEMYSAK